MEGFFRRSGIWYARLAVPLRLRGLFGKSEFVSSTRHRDPVMARIVAGELLACWRRKFHDFDRLQGSGSMAIDFERLATPHPALAAGGYLSIVEAELASGLDVPTLLRQVSTGQLGLFHRASGVSGYLCALAKLIKDFWLPNGGVEVPPSRSRPAEAVELSFGGMLAIRAETLADVSTALIADEAFESVLFVLADDRTIAFAPDVAIQLRRSNVEVDVDRLAKLRSIWATRMPVSTPLSHATPVLTPKPFSAHLEKRVSEAIDVYVVIRGRDCALDQARRIRNALDLYAELDGDPKLAVPMSPGCRMPWKRMNARHQ